MHTDTRKARRLGVTLPVEQVEIDHFLILDSTRQFDVLRQLRTDAAHLSGGSMSAFTAAYISVVLVAIPLMASSIVNSWPVGGSIGLGAFILIAGLVLARSSVLYQRDLARSATRLAFFEEALSRASRSGAR